MPEEMPPRVSSSERASNETKIALKLFLDEAGENKIDTGLGMLDHFLDLLAHWGGMRLDVSCKGDLDVDAHHTVEDVGLVLGMAFHDAVGDARSIERVGFGRVPMDEAMAEVSVDISGRPWIEWRGDEILPPLIGGEEKDVWREFYKAFASTARINLHVAFLYGKTDTICWNLPLKVWVWLCVRLLPGMVKPFGAPKEALTYENGSVSCLFVSFFCAACSRQPTSTADVPRLLSQSYKIAVAPFVQPLHGGQLIMGNIPENQGKIPPDDLLALDLDLRQILLSKTHRQYNFLRVDEKSQVSQASAQPRGLQFWLNFGREHNLQYLLAPQILDWHEREGSEAGVQKSAHVRMEMFLINVPTGVVAGRAVFEEKQVGLVDNLLGVADFVKRKGQWVSARQLTEEGMLKAVKELGL